MSTTPPIPPPKDDDAEDVFWALSTATTLHTRGEYAESLKWLRRAAEQASDQNADGRAVELMKAAAELTARLNGLPAAPAARASTPPPLPKRAAPSIPAMPSRPPPLPSAPPRAIPSPPSVPRALAVSAPVKAAPRTGRERQATLTGRRVAARRGSITDLGKVARPPGIPAEIPDTPVDDLDEETNVYEGKTKLAKGRKPISSEPASKPITAPSALPMSPSSKPRGVPAPPPSKPSASVPSSTPKPSAMKGEPASRPEGAKPEASAKAPAAKVDVPSKSISAGEIAKPTARPALQADILSKPVAVKVVEARKLAPTVEKGGMAPSNKAETALPVARAATQRKGTMQLVDEGFESMLDAPEPPSVAVPIFVELPIPPEEKRDVAVDAPVRPEREPRASNEGVRALFAQRVAVIADPSGSARVVLLDDLSSLPSGAVAAIVVALSPDDGEHLERLLRGQKG